MGRIKHVVFDRREGLRWWFVDTQKPWQRYLISLYPKDLKWFFINGFYLLVPPFRTKHIRGVWG